MSKPFFDVFPKLKVRKDLQDYFQDTQVERLATNRERTRLKVCLRSDHLIHKDRVFRMQEAMEKQLFGERKVEVYMEEHYDLSAQYTPQSLMEAYSDSIMCEISSFSPVMGVFFRDAAITYGENGTIDVCMRDTCVSRGLQDRLEEALNRIFRDRCGVPATLTVTLKAEVKEQSFAGEDSSVTGASEYAYANSGFGESDKSEYAAEPDAAAAYGSKNAGGMTNGGSKDAGSGSGSSGGRAAMNNGASGNGKGYGRGNSTGYGRGGRFGKDKKGEREYSLKRSSHPDVIFGREVTADAIRIADVIGEIGEVVIRGQIIGNDRRDIRNEKTIVKFSLTDFTDSIYCKIFVPTDKADELLKDLGKGSFVKVRGAAVMDTFDKEVIISSIQGIMKIPSFVTSRVDDAPVKRIELHCHTKMSDMDGVSECKNIVKRAYSWGMPAIAITDHGNIQAFPDAGHVREDLFKSANKKRKENGEAPIDNQDFFKVLYGVECYLVDDLVKSIDPVPEEDLDSAVKDRPVVVFDLETTGFSPEKNKIIEIGAVRIENGKVRDRFSQFVNPEVPIPYKITQLTGISDSMVIEAKTIELVLPYFLRFCQGCILVGHNVQFDIGFIRENAI